MDSRNSLLAPAGVAALLLVATAAHATDPADLIDPSIGVLAGGGTVIGPTLPHGSIHPSPDGVGGGYDGYKPGIAVRGFSQLHPSGVGWGRYGCLLFSPQTGLDVTPEGHESPLSEERAAAYFFEARLSRYDILTEIAPTQNCALYRLTFPEGESSHLLLDLGHQIPGQIMANMKVNGVGVDQSTLTISPDGRSVSGSSRYLVGWGAGPYTVYFHAELDQPPAAKGTFKNAQINSDQFTEQCSAPNERVGGWWRFSTKAGQPVHLKVGVSFHSVEKARAHLAKEIPGWDLATVRDAARAAWNQHAGLIEVSGGTEAQRTQFYTAMYHAQIMPRDRMGEFARFPADVPMWDDHYAIWDTWRTKYPLMMLIQPDMVRGTIASFVERLRVDGHVRDSFTAGTDGREGIADQGGNDLDNIIADAYVKGLKNVDWQAAYGVLKFNAENERKGNFKDGEEDYRRQGWIRGGIMSVSNTLEYAYNDFVTAQIARALGKNEDAEKYAARARQWRQLFNPATASDGFKGFIVPKNADGTWAEVDVKRYYGSWKDFYYEAPAWNYSFFVPHQAGLLIDLMGGTETFVRRLELGVSGILKDSNNNPVVDIGNEPAFLAPHLFHYAGRPDLAAKHVKKLIRTRFSLRGYPGDDDSGAMSSYFVFASLGLFPNAGQDLYFLNGPMFDRLVVTRPEEGKLEITRTGGGDYVAGLTVNGKPWDHSWIRHTDIKGDTILAFTMSETPTTWGTETPPPSPGSTTD